MKTTGHATVSSLIVALMAIGSAAETPPQAPMRAADGTVVAMWQKTPNPNKPYIAQLFAPGVKSVPLLDDSPADHFHHHGLMFALNVNDTDFWADPATPPAVGGEKVCSGDWCAVRNTFEGRTVTVLMLAHPDNPRPGEWFTMSRPFCYLSATLNLKKEPFTLVKGRSWTLRYSLAVLSTPADHTRLAKIAAAWKISNPFTTTEKSNLEKP